MYQFLLGITAFTNSQSRKEIISFSMPIVDIEVKLFIRKFGGYNLTAYFDPFRCQLWASVGIFCLLSAFIMYIVAK